MLMKMKQRIIIRWLKRIAVIMTILIWVYVIYSFLKNPAPFSELALYCMGSTMLIFTLLSAAFKGLEYWEQQL